VGVCVLARYDATIYGKRRELPVNLSHPDERESAGDIREFDKTLGGMATFRRR
jgi:hypothetical protein